jgi:exosortase E/protease (VPEID-CTERM system)
VSLVDRWHRRGLFFRVLFLALLFTSELIIISIFLDGAALLQAKGLGGLIGGWGAWALRAIVGTAALSGTLLWLKDRAALERMSQELAEVPIAWGVLGFHAIAMAVFAVLSSQLYGLKSDGAAALLGKSAGQNAVAAGWLIAGIAGIAFGACALVPWKYWRRLFDTGGLLWIYAFAAILLAEVAGNFSRYLWEPATRVTFSLVRLMLKPFVAGLFTNPSRAQLGTARFHVIIAPECSGLEGAGLIIAFGLVWLLLFRRECRFPQSLALLPAGVLVLFLLNSVRIAALVLIGNAGAEQIAIGGFHSQAGWILFNIVAVGFCLTIRNVRWFTNRALAGQQLAAVGFASGSSVDDAPRAPESQASRTLASENPTAAYLLPFLAILAAGMIATAASSPFEWFYPLRMVAAGGALWIYRKRYASLNWQASWRGIASGVAVFLLWIGCDRLFGGGAREYGEPAALLTASSWVRTSWIALRAVAAVTTVPFAEELAFRGFLMRRLVAADFESVSPPRVTWLALVISSVVFGVLHGGLWIAGIAAGVIFGLVWKWRGNFGDAVAAHASANALLALYVLYYGQWHLW